MPGPEPQLVDAGGVTHRPLAVYDTDSGLISATFDLTGLPVGKADVQVVNSGGVTQTLPHAFDVIAGSPGQLVTNLIAPSQVARRAALHGDRRIHEHRRHRHARAHPVPHGYRPEPAQFHAGHEQPHDLPRDGGRHADRAGRHPSPGSTEPLHGLRHRRGHGTASFHLLVGDIEDEPIDWSSVESQIRPDGVPDATWEPIFAQIQSEIGDTWQGYAAAISTATTLLPPLAGLELLPHRRLQSLPPEHAGQPDAVDLRSTVPE